MPSIAKSGELTFKQRVPSGGKVPRYFSFDPSNHWLLVSNQEGANVSVFSVDAKTGELDAEGLARAARRSRWPWSS